MNWKHIERVIFIGIIFVLSLYIVSPYVYFFGQPDSYEVVNIGLLKSIDNQSIRLDYITYHCGYFDSSEYQQFVGEYVKVTMVCYPDISFSINNIELMEEG